VSCGAEPRSVEDDADLARGAPVGDAVGLVGLRQRVPVGDDELAAVPVGEQSGQRGQDRAVGPGWSGRFDVALENCDLVAQDQDFGVFGQV
jgi:hypothetical protein